MIQKIASFFDKVWAWLVVSSANETSISLTVKGFLGTGIATLMVAIGVVHLQIPGLSDILNSILDQIILIIQYGLGIVSAISTVVGLVRKLILSIKGTHAALQ